MKKVRGVSFGFVVACALVLMPQVSIATTIPVDYTVDAKDLKKNAPAGTMITIELHQDAACSSAIATQVVDIDSIQIIESIKSAAIKDGTKKPNIARLNYVFTGIASTVSGDMFVKITAATGITPVGGACQAQEPVAPQGAIGPTGPVG